MRLETTASLIVAAFELSAVQLIRGAIRTADLSSGRGTSATPLGPDPNPPFAGPGGGGRFHVSAEPVYEPRRHVQPTPRFEERTVYYTVRREAGYEQADNAASACPAFCAAAVVIPEPACSMEGLIPPVWKTLPPVEHPAPARRVMRITRHRAEGHHKGIVVDVHV